MSLNLGLGYAKRGLKHNFSGNVLKLELYGLYMRGYDAIFKLNLSYKTMQISYECLNRTCWTNLMQNLTRIARGGEIDTPNCTLCGRTETTLHLMFECEKLAEPLWQLLAEIITPDLREREESKII
jgi:hypothetical protein